MKTEEYIKGIKERDISILGKAITLIESSLEKDKNQAEKLIEKCRPLIKNTIKIAVSGTPGVGKSTFIEALGSQLIEKNNRIAILAIDPSSALSKGSILGDKTRMHKLSNSKLAFIRPSPNSGTLGGVAHNTKSVITICEAAGFEIIIVETVGVGQAEFIVKSMTDFFIYLTLIENGDELQFSKKGILELSDVVLINKADQNKKRAKEVAFLLKNSLDNYQYDKNVFICSALTGLNIHIIWEHIKNLYIKKTETGELQKNRKEQDLLWFKKNIKHEIKNLFFKKIKIENIVSNLSENKKKSPRRQALEIIKKMLKEDEK